MKKSLSFIFLLAILLTAFTLAGCGSGGNDGGDYYGGDYYNPYAYPTYYPTQQPYPNPTTAPFPSPVNPTYQVTYTLGKIYALFIGIEKYDNHPNLNYSVDDSNAMYSALLPGTYNNLWKMAEYTVLNDSQATKANIVTTIYNIAAKMTPYDSFFLFYSGHGTNPDKENATIYTENYICPVDCTTDTATMISSQELRQMLLAIPSDSYKIIYLDACFSGGMIAKDPKLTRKYIEIPKQPEDSYKKNGGFKSIGNDINNVSVTTASSYNQYSYETSEYAHGILTYYLINGLGLTGDTIGYAFPGAATAIGSQELYGFVRAAITTQDPQYYTNPYNLNPMIKGNI